MLKLTLTLFWWISSIQLFAQHTGAWKDEMIEFEKSNYGGMGFWGALIFSIILWVFIYHVGMKDKDDKN
jgi:prolipoprotein diacylglyceryltransferase